MRPLLSALILITSPAVAETPMNAEAFESYSTGKTLYFGEAGAPYGAEQYLPGRKVIWSYLDGECREGEWYEVGSQICFVYEGSPDIPQCWSFFDRPDGIMARFENDARGTVLIEVEQSREPLTCRAPWIGT